MSAELVWQIVRKSNSKLIKRSGVVFSKECTNPTKIHSLKYSGIANSKVASVESTGKKFALITKKSSAVNQPIKAVVTRRFKGEVVRKAVNSELSGYRADLKSAVFARIAKLNRVKVAKAAAAAKKA